MGPIALFDKSFLQSLNLNESLFFDHFFLTVICPIFFVETLADLEKAVREGRTPEQEVGIIADKTPELNGVLCANHLHMIANSFLGHEIPMDGRVPRSGGKHVRVRGEKGLVYEQSLEEEAFHRWQQRQFLDVERRFASIWRRSVKSDIGGIAAALDVMGVRTRDCKTLEDAQNMAQSFVESTDAPLDRMNLARIVLGLPAALDEPIYERWKESGFRSLSTHSPFAAYALKVTLFFHIAVGAKLLTPDDRMDVSYLLYLPFCMMFVSTDKLHRRIAPLFLRPDQDFVWGPDLKSDLKRIVGHYLEQPEAEREKGIFKLAPCPPG